MMMDENGNEEKEQDCASLSRDAKQEVDSGEEEGNRSIGGDDQVGENRKEECVYFLQTPDERFIKIGFTTNIQRRVSQLEKTLGPTPIKLLGYIPGNRFTERFLHMKFAADRERGEWFRATPEIHAVIDTIGLLLPPPRPPLPLKPESRRKRAKPRRSYEATPSVNGKNSAAVELGRRGGQARAQKLTPERQSEIGRNAGLVGGRARANALSKNLRRDIASRAGMARWNGTTADERRTLARNAAAARWGK